MKNRFLGFLVGTLCGAAVGAVIALLITPSNGKDLREELVKHWQNVLEEAKKAQEETRRQLENEFKDLKL